MKITTTIIVVKRGNTIANASHYCSNITLILGLRHHQILKMIVVIKRPKHRIKSIYLKTDLSLTSVCLLSFAIERRALRSVLFFCLAAYFTSLLLRTAARTKLG